MRPYGTSLHNAGSRNTCLHLAERYIGKEESGLKRPTIAKHAQSRITSNEGLEIKESKRNGPLLTATMPKEVNPLCERHISWGHVDDPVMRCGLDVYRNRPMCHWAAC
jgi:hypothetical protein